jgi:hypothetical protein
MHELNVKVKALTVFGSVDPLPVVYITVPPDIFPETVRFPCLFVLFTDVSEQPYKKINA